MDKTSTLRDYSKLRGSNELPPLIVAAQYGLKLVAKYLIETCHVDLNEICAGTTALNSAIVYGEFEIAKYFLNQPGVKVNKFDDSETPPLHIAVCQSKEITELLLSFTEININYISASGFTAFETACWAGNADIVELFLSLPAERGLITGFSENRLITSSHVACMQGHLPVIRRLANHQCFDPLTPNIQGDDALGHACHHGQINTLRYIFQDYFKTISIDLSSKDMQQYIEKQLKLSAYSGQLEVVEFLLEYISLENITDNQPFNMLLRCVLSAIGQNKAKTVVLLLKKAQTITNPKWIGTVAELFGLRCMLWSHFKEVTREVFQLWLKTFRLLFGLCTTILAYFRYPNTIDSNARIRAFYEKQFLSLRDIFHSCFYDDEECVIEKRMLYHSMHYKLPEVVHLVLNVVPHIVEDHLKSKSYVDGIHLLEFAMQNSEIAEIFKRHFPKYCNDFQKRASQFREWYNKVSFLSSSFSLTDYDEIPCNRLAIAGDVYTVINEPMTRAFVLGKLRRIKQFIRQHETSNERDVVIDAIIDFVKLLANEVSQINKLYAITPVLVGSSKEKTKPFMPNEFDFLLVCEEFQKHLSIEDEPDNGMFAVIKIKDKNDPLIPTGLVKNNDLLDMKNFKEKMDQLLVLAIQNVFVNKTQHRFLTKETNFYEVKKISCLHLRWRGDEYKDMEIKLDLVPAFEHKYYQPLKQYFETPCRYFVFCKENDRPQEIYPVAFSDVEIKLISSLPQEAREGFKLAKGIRISRIFPNKVAAMLRNVFNIEDYLPTYWLKTCLILVSKHVPSECSLLPEEWAYLIYKDLNNRFLYQNRLPTLFDFRFHSMEDPLFICDEKEALPVNEERACCIKRRNLIVLTTFFIRVLELDCLNIEESDIRILLDILGHVARDYHSRSQ